MAFDPISTVLEVGGKVIDRLWPDPAKAEEAKMKLAEMQQSGELAVMANETETLKAVLADVASARQREAEIAVSEHAPYINKIITPVLALIVTIGGGLMIYGSQDQDTKLLCSSLITLVLGYYFGTSIGSAQGREQIKKLIGGK